MGLFSFLKRKAKRQTLTPGFRNYKQGPSPIRKPIVPKFTSAKPAPSLRLKRNQEDRKIRIKWSFKLFFLLIGLLGSLYAIFLSPWFTIETVDLRGQEDTLQEQSGIQKYLASYIGKNILFFNSSEHEAKLLTDYPYLKKVKISRKPFHTLVAELETHPHVANLEIMEDNKKTADLVVNAGGAIAAIGSPNKDLPIIVMDLSGTKIPLLDTPPETGETGEIEDQKPSWTLNQNLIEAQTLETLLSVKKNFEDKFDLKIEKVEYLKRAREIHLLTEKGFYVWMDLSQDIQSQLLKMKKSMAKLNIYESDLQYIDLRISGQNGEKVLYKLN